MGWFGSFDPQQIVGAMNCIAQNLEVILDPGLGHQTLIIDEQGSGLCRSIGSVNQSGRVGVANRCLEVLALLIEDRLDLLLKPVLLSAHFGTQRKQRTP